MVSSRSPDDEALAATANTFPRLVKDVSRAQNADDAHQNPKCVQREIGGVALEPGTAGQHDGVYGVENPDEHERAFRPKPAHKAEAENPHQHARHLDGFDIAKNKRIHAGILTQARRPCEPKSQRAIICRACHGGRFAPQCGTRNGKLERRQPSPVRPRFNSRRRAVCRAGMEDFHCAVSSR